MKKRIKQKEFNLLNIILNQKKFFIWFFIIFFCGFTLFELYKSEYVSNVKFITGETKNLFQKIISSNDLIEKTNNSKNSFNYIFLFEYTVNDLDFLNSFKNFLKRNSDLYNKIEKDIDKILRTIYVRQINKNIYEFGISHSNVDISLELSENLKNFILSYDFISNIYKEKEKYKSNLKQNLDESLKKYENNLIKLQDYYINNNDNIDITLQDYKNIIKKYVELRKSVNDIEQQIVIYKSILENLSEKPFDFIYLKFTDEIRTLFGMESDLFTKFTKLNELKQKRLEKKNNDKDVLSYTKEINNLRNEFVNNLNNSIKNFLVELLNIKTNKEEILDKLNKQIKVTPKKQLELLSLKKSVDISESHYQNLVEEYIKLNLEINEGLRLNVITKPKIEGRFNYIFRKNITTYFLLILILDLLIIIFIEFKNKYIRSSDELKDFLDKNKINNLKINLNQKKDLKLFESWVLKIFSDSGKFVFFDTTMNEKFYFKNNFNKLNINYEFYNLNYILDNQQNICDKKNIKIIIIRLNKTEYANLEYVIDIFEILKIKIDFCLFVE